LLNVGANIGIVSPDARIVVAVAGVVVIDDGAVGMIEVGIGVEVTSPGHAGPAPIREEEGTDAE